MQAHLRDYFTYTHNTEGYINGITATLGAAFAVLLGYYLLHLNFIAATWMALPSFFAIFYRAGTSKWRQLFYSLEYGCYGVIIVALAALIMIYGTEHLTICLGALAFACVAVAYLRSGSASVGVFLAVYVAIVMMFYQNFHFFTSANYVYYLEQQSLGFALGVVLYSVIMLVLPLASAPVADTAGDSYQLVRALRISIGFMIAIAFSADFGIYNVAWVCFAILVIAQNALGDTIAKAIQRLIGTALGIGAGILLAHFIASLVQLFSFSILVFIFLSNLLMKKDYKWGLFFLTLMLTATYFLFRTAKVTVDHYLLARLVDTAFGLAIGVLCETLILPQSYIIKLRVGICVIYRDLWFIGMFFKNQVNNPGDLKEIMADMKFRADQIAQYLSFSKFEPLMLLSKRYTYFKGMPHALQRIEAALLKVADSDLTTQEAQSQWLIATYGMLRNFYQRPERENYGLITKQAEELPPLLLTATPEMNELLTATHVVLELHLKVYNTPRWKLRLR